MQGIEIEHLSQYYGRRPALRDVSLTVPPGLYGLLGRNGAGKTTLMRTVAALLPCRAGRVRVCGVPADDAHAARVRALIGYLPQDFAAYPSLTVRETLAYLGTLSGMSGAALARRVPAVLRQVNLTEQAGKRVKALSGGMLRRLGVAQALLHDPPVLIVDEPTAGLDPEERVRLRGLLAALAGGGKTVVFSTHIAGDIEAVCRGLAILDGGRLLYAGTAADLKRRTGARTLEQAYLAFVQGGAR